jgi:hypothetical protein
MEEPTAANLASIAFDWLPNFERGNDPSPVSVRFYEVDIAAGATIEYTRFAEFSVADQAAFEKEMARLIQDGGDIGKPPKRHTVNGKFVGNQLAVGWGDPDAATAISYLVFRLSPKIDWSFGFDDKLGVPGFSMRDGQRGKRCFVSGGKFAPDGQHFGADSSDASLAECRFAYFVVNGPKLPDAGKKEFNRKFNLHVDLLERDASGTIVARTPILIDPEIRNPGGSGG